jgi:hypothetical protein
MSAVDPHGKRQIAKQNGDKTYFTGLPCKHGHVGSRYTSNAICVTCKHDTFKKRYEKNREIVLAQGQAWKDVNRERVNQYAKEYREKYPELVKQTYKKYRAANRDVHVNNERIRQLKKMQAMPKWLTSSQIDWIDVIYKRAKDIQNRSGIKMAVDHIVPLRGKTVCGLHVPWNLRVISVSENSKKHAKFDEKLCDLPISEGCIFGKSALPWNWSLK